MSFIQFKQRSKSNYVPALYTADETAALVAVNVGEIVSAAFCKVRVAFNGSGGRTGVVGDGGSTNRFITTGLDITTASTAPYSGVGAGFATTPGYLYTTADTIDLTFVAATGGGPTAGNLDFWFWIARSDPH